MGEACIRCAGRRPPFSHLTLAALQIPKTCLTQLAWPVATMIAAGAQPAEPRGEIGPHLPGPVLAAYWSSPVWSRTLNHPSLSALLSPIASQAYLSVFEAYKMVQALVWLGSWR